MSDEERLSLSNEDENRIFAIELLNERLSNDGTDAVQFLFGFLMGGMVCRVRNAIDVVNLVGMAESAYESAREAQGGTLKEAFEDAIKRHERKLDKEMSHDNG